MTTSESKADFFTKRIDSHNESIRIANWNALMCTALSTRIIGGLTYYSSVIPKHKQTEAGRSLWAKAIKYNI